MFSFLPITGVWQLVLQYVDLFDLRNLSTPAAGQLSSLAKENYRARLVNLLFEGNDPSRIITVVSGICEEEFCKALTLSTQKSVDEKESIEAVKKAITTINDSEFQKVWDGLYKDRKAAIKERINVHVNRGGYDIYLMAMEQNVNEMTCIEEMRCKLKIIPDVPILIKQADNYYLLGNTRGVHWDITLLDGEVCKPLSFPQPGEAPVLLRYNTDHIALYFDALHYDALYLDIAQKAAHVFNNPLSLPNAIINALQVVTMFNDEFFQELIGHTNDEKNDAIAEYVTDQSCYSLNITNMLSWICLHPMLLEARQVKLVAVVLAFHAARFANFFVASAAEDIFIHQDIVLNKLALMKKLIQLYPAFVNLQSKDRLTLLQIALKGSRLQLAEHVFEQPNTVIDVGDEKEQRPLWLLMKSDVPVVQKVRFAKLFCRRGIAPANLLLMAVIQNNKGFFDGYFYQTEFAGELNQLVDNFLGMKMPDGVQATPLHITLANNKPRVAKWLLDQKGINVDVTIPDAKGTRPLQTLLRNDIYFGDQYDLGMLFISIGVTPSALISEAWSEGKKDFVVNCFAREDFIQMLQASMLDTESIIALQDPIRYAINNIEGRSSKMKLRSLFASRDEIDIESEYDLRVYGYPPRRGRNPNQVLSAICAGSGSSSRLKNALDVRKHCFTGLRYSIEFLQCVVSEDALSLLGSLYELYQESRADNNVDDTNFVSDVLLCGYDNVRLLSEVIKNEKFGIKPNQIKQLLSKLNQYLQQWLNDPSNVESPPINFLELVYLANHRMCLWVIKPDLEEGALELAEENNKLLQELNDLAEEIQEEELQLQNPLIFFGNNNTSFLLLLFLFSAVFAWLIKLAAETSSNLIKIGFMGCAFTILLLIGDACLTKRTTLAKSDFVYDSKVASLPESNRRFLKWSLGREVLATETIKQCIKTVAERLAIETVYSKGYLRDARKLPCKAKNNNTLSQAIDAGLTSFALPKPQRRSATVTMMDTKHSSPVLRK